jgi:hypothetical protein
MVRLVSSVVCIVLFSCGTLMAKPDSPEKDSAAFVPYSLTKSPTTAILYSCMLPGLGQYYVESYWKIPIFTGATGFLVYAIIANNGLFSDVEAEVAQLELTNSSVNANAIALLKREREVYRDRRDLAWIGLGAVYVIAAIDAYTGAHLFDFDVSDKIAGSLSPNPAIAGINFTLRW